MAVMREMWSDDRLDGLNRRVDDGFALVDERFEQMDKRFEQMGDRLDRFEDQLGQVNVRLDGIQQTLVQAVVAFYATAVACFVAIIGLILAQA